MFGDSVLAEAGSATHAVAAQAWLPSQSPLKGKESKPQEKLLLRECGHFQSLSQQAWTPGIWVMEKKESFQYCLK